MITNRAITALREPDACLACVPNTVRQSIADLIESQQRQIWPCPHDDTGGLWKPSRSRAQNNQKGLIHGRKVVRRGSYRPSCGGGDW